jgi:hypothetical protein
MITASRTVAAQVPTVLIQGAHLMAANPQNLGLEWRIKKKTNKKRNYESVTNSP